MKTVAKIVSCWVAGLALAFAAVTAQAGVAAPQTSYSFSGVCTDCLQFELGINAEAVGVTVHGTLVLQDYTVGDPFNNEHFVSFTYESNVVGELFASQDSLLSLEGGFTAPLGFEDVVIEWSSWRFFTCASFAGACNPGRWGLSETGSRDEGILGIWGLADAAAVPEPASLALLLLGLAGLGASRRLRG